MGALRTTDTRPADAAGPAGDVPGRHPPQVRPVTARVRLVAHTAQPFAIAVASARTCYAKDFVFVGQLTPLGERKRVTLLEALGHREADLDAIGDPRTDVDQRQRLVESVARQAPSDDVRAALHAFAENAEKRAPNDARIAQSIYDAGHHTPFQHPTFVFALEDVSRNVVESFFHQHSFYNSEQQSQRYVEMDEAAVVVPDSVVGTDARAVYDAAVARAWGAYHDLRGRLVAANLKVMSSIGRIKGQTEKQVRTEAEKKAQEMARYVIPIAAATRLYHTVSGIVLMRYIRMANATGAHSEARQVVAQMVEAVRGVDPDFVEKIQEEAHRMGDLPEWQLADDAAPAGPSVDLEGRTSRLLNATPDAPALVTQVLREVTGSGLDDAELLRSVLDPGRDRLWNDTLNTWDHSHVLRALRHVHYTFHKRLSLTAYAQDQRHRMTPATRPLVHRLVTPAPDVHTPDVIERDAGALAVYDDAVHALWDAMHTLVEAGVPKEDAAYLLPNATNQYYTQSGDLLSWIHKWRLRLCFNAQKEIFDASLDELRQVQAVHPELTRWLGPPCTFVAAAQPQELQDSVEACCPEGPRWCGVKVWKGFDAGTGKPKRPY